MNNKNKRDNFLPAIWCHQCKKTFDVYPDENNKFSLESLSNVNNGFTLVELKNYYLESNSLNPEVFPDVRIVRRCWCCHRDIKEVVDRKVPFNLFDDEYPSYYALTDDRLEKTGFCYECASSWITLARYSDSHVCYFSHLRVCDKFGRGGIWQCRECKALSLKKLNSNIRMVPRNILKEDKQKKLSSEDKLEAQNTPH